LTQDEILAALREVVAANNQYTTWTVSTPHLVALVNLAIDREREACAKIADIAEPYKSADLIRARGQA